MLEKSNYSRTRHCNNPFNSHLNESACNAYSLAESHIVKPIGLISYEYGSLAPVSGSQHAPFHSWSRQRKRTSKNYPLKNPFYRTSLLNTDTM